MKLVRSREPEKPKKPETSETEVKLRTINFGAGMARCATNETVKPPAPRFRVSSVSTIPALPAVASTADLTFPNKQYGIRFEDE